MAEESIIVSFNGPHGTIMLEMMNENERFYVRTYSSVDAAITRFERLYESVHGEQTGPKMGDNFRLDPRIHVVEGDNVTTLIREDIVDMDDFRVFGTRTEYGTILGVLASGPAAESWHGQGIVPGLVKI